VPMYTPTKCLLAKCLLAAGMVLAATAAQAQNLLPEIPGPEYGKLLATGGLSNLEGAGGGGLASWATITGYGTRDGFGGDLHYTYVNLPRYTLHTEGAAFGLGDRVELSYAHQYFDTGATGQLFGLGKGYAFQQDIYAAKVRLFGNVVYDQDSLLPQVSAGVMFKSNSNGPVIKALGAQNNQGVDYYLAFTKLFLDQSLIVNATVRATKANELGILGFGGPKGKGYTAQFEGSVGYLLTRNIAFGGEYRTMPSNLAFSKSSDWKDVFATYFINKNASITLAYANLGTVATFKNQQGVYVSAKVGF